MAEEFFNTMASYSEAPLKERVEGMGEVIEKIMTILLKIPEMVDGSVQSLATQINGLSSRIGALEGKYNQLDTKITQGLANVRASGGGGSPGAPPPPPGGGAPPPPPPGGGSPPPPPGKPAPANNAPANPMSLRGSIMDELKTLFSKRRAASEEDE